MSKTEARIIDQTLVVSAQDAQTPSLWRGELSAYKSANFSVSVLKTKASLKVQLSDGRSETIADYANKEAANEALGEITKILFGAETPVLSGYKPVTVWRKILMFFQIVIFAAIATFLTMIFLPIGTSEMRKNTLQKSSAPLAKEVTKEEGKPVSANDFFAE